MSAALDAMPSMIERIRHDLVGLKMPRALEALDHVVRRLEHGELSALEAIDILLSEELTLRENSRIKTALRMGRLATIKTLTGFDFSFQPSLDRDRIFTLAQLGFIDRCEAVHFLGPPGTGKSHLATALGVEAVKAGKSVYFCTLADLIASLSRAEREGRLQERIRFFCRPSLLIVDEIGYLPVIAGGGNLFWLCRMGRSLRGSRRRYRPARQTLAPRRRRSDRRLKLSAATARRAHARACSLESAHHSAVLRTATKTKRPATEKWPSLPVIRSGIIGESYFGTFGEISGGIDTCWRGLLDNGEPRCIAFGGLRVDDAIEEALLGVVEPGAIAAAVEADRNMASQRDQVQDALLRDLEAARYAADRAFRQYDAADPENRLVTWSSKRAGIRRSLA